MDWLTGKKKGKGGESVSKLLGSESHARALIVSGDLRPLSSLPPGESEEEWLATYTLMFFNNVSLIYSTIEEACTKDSCPIMCAGPKTEYIWTDEKGKKVKGLSAPEYSDFALTWINSIVTNENAFPSRLGIDFPSNYQQIVRRVFRLLFQILSHIFCHHLEDLVELRIQPHANTVLLHTVVLCKEFNLLDEKDLLPLSGYLQLAGVL
eukprot:Clim_evm36s232 gene=Clim_evmTU36s232